MEIRHICRGGTGVVDPLFEDSCDDLSSALGDGGSSGLLGPTGLTECKMRSNGRIGLRRHARRRRGITQKEGREKRRRTKKNKENH